MTISGQHPNRESYVRALFTVSNRRGSFQLLSNPERVIRSDWNWFFNFRGYSLTRITL